MKITQMKINGIREPLGFEFDGLTASWKVEDTPSKKAQRQELTVASDPEFRNILLSLEGNELDSAGADLDVELRPRTRYYWKVSVLGDEGDRAEAESFFETGKMGEPFAADWIAAKEPYHPTLLKAFTSDRVPKRARLYVSGVGLFEAYLNDEKLGEEYLTPYVTDYEKGIQIITFDLDGLVKQGGNLLEIYLGKGWYMGLFGLELQSNNYGNRMAAIAELHLEYIDGTEEVIGTDDSWTSRGSDMEESGIYDGEVYNRLLYEGRDNEPQPVDVITDPASDPGTENLVKEHLRDRLSLPVIEKERLSAVEVIHTPAGETVLDFGQNLTGFVTFRADFPKGTRIRFEFGEILQGGNFYHKNYRDAKSEFVYVSNGEPETVRAHFTYFGFRYAKVTGWPGELKKDAVEAVNIYSDLDQTGEIRTGNEKINRLFLNTLWGQKDNFLDMPTDCPQRSERLGWTGDAQVFSPTANYNMDTRAFFHKFERDLRDEQETLGGAVPNYVPNIGHKKDAGPVWGDVGTFLPWNVYRCYGDKKELKQAYPMMKDWADWVDRGDKDRKYLDDYDFTFGDWLALDGATPTSFKGSTDDTYIASAYRMRSAQIVAEAAKILGYKEDAEHYRKLAENVKAAIEEEYFTPSGRCAVDTQTALIVALKFGIGSSREKLARQLRTRFRKDMYQIRGGFVGAPLLCTVLGENGMTDLAYDFLLNEKFPGWLFEVNMGATTIWERWNSVGPDGVISDTGMNSLNHYSYGSVMEFVYAYAGGIRPAVPGFRKAILAPEPDPRLGSMEASYDSVCGKYVCSWKIHPDGTLTVKVQIPFGCTADVTLPFSGEETKTFPAGSCEFTYRPEKDYLHPYGWDTGLSGISGNPKIMEILGRLVPPLAGMAASGDPEMGANSFRDISHMGYLPIDPEALKKAVSEIEKVPF